MQKWQLVLVLFSSSYCQGPGVARMMTYLTLRLSCLAQIPTVFSCVTAVQSHCSDIPVKIIKKCNKFISPILAQHFNNLIKIGKFPDDLKTGKITPIYKKDNAELLENYRPAANQMTRVTSGMVEHARQAAVRRPPNSQETHARQPTHARRHDSRRTTAE